MSQNQLANAYFDIGQWREADHNYRHSREAFNLLGDVYNRAFADNNLGGIALNQGRLDDALAFYRAALSSLERIGGSDYVLGVLHSNLGGTFTRRGEIDAAREHLQASLKHFEQAQSRDFLPELYRRFAEAALASGGVAEAAERAEQALSIARELSMRGEEGISLRLLAQARGTDAEQLLRESLAILEDVKDEYESARARAALAEARLSQDRREEALAEIDRCIDVFRRLDAALDLEAAQALRDRAARES
jgi:tetratricopeptide (TPR) repeat protein